MTADSKVVESVAVKAEHWVVAKVDHSVVAKAGSTVEHSDSTMLDELDDD